MADNKTAGAGGADDWGGGPQRQQQQQSQNPPAAKPPARLDANDPLSRQQPGLTEHQVRTGILPAARLKSAQARADAGDGDDGPEPDESDFPDNFAECLALLRKGTDMPVKNAQEAKEKAKFLEALRRHSARLQQGLPQVVTHADHLAKENTEARKQALKNTRWEMFSRGNQIGLEMFDEITRLNDLVAGHAEMETAYQAEIAKLTEALALANKK